MNADELRALARTIETVRVAALFGGDDDTDLTPEAEAHFLAALAQLDIAKRNVDLATYALMQRR
jgi:hypothetical protein